MTVNSEAILPNGSVHAIVNKNKHKSAVYYNCKL